MNESGGVCSTPGAGCCAQSRTRGILGLESRQNRRSSRVVPDQRPSQVTAPYGGEPGPFTTPVRRCRVGPSASVNMVSWLANDVEHAKHPDPAEDGYCVIVTRLPDGAYAPTTAHLPVEETASLRAELAVPAGWILETIYYDLGPTD